MGAAKDLTGLRVNQLTVLEKTNNRSASGCIKWLCRCDCGNTCEVISSRLTSGQAKSCGCLSKKALEKGRGNWKDITGQKFGKLTAIERIKDYISKDGERYFTQWLCECECGRQTKVLSCNLTTGNTQSCGFCKENSHGNIKIEELLKQANIVFEREKRFETCKYKSYLPFDFYVDNKYLIEYDGKQHSENNPNSLYYSEDISLRDKIKTQWCKENNIPLIRIPYTHYKDLCLEDLLLETSNFIE